MSDPVLDLLSALHRDPGDVTCWQALADALEERGEPDRAEVVRLSLRYWGWVSDQPFDSVDERLQYLLASKVRPCVPERVNSIGMRFALIPAGTFLMGSPEEEEDRDVDEGPRHEMKISRSFYLGVFPVTQSQYERVMGKNPSYFSQTGEGKETVAALDTMDFPVEQVSWEDANAFCRKLNEREQADGWLYRLPSETEWEYSCRGGASSFQVFHFGNRFTSTLANFDGNYPCGGAEQGPYLERTCPVGTYPPNAFGLFDLHGNVWEWCHYWFSDGKDAIGPFEGSHRVIRGGSWYSVGRDCEAVHRNWLESDNRGYDLGFRVLAVPGGAR